ncbi:hypothetical protein EJB05_01599, partial [Eragrostis curvula]
MTIGPGQGHLGREERLPDLGSTVALAGELLFSGKLAAGSGCARRHLHEIPLAAARRRSSWALAGLFFWSAVVAGAGALLGVSLPCRAATAAGALCVGRDR